MSTPTGIERPAGDASNIASEQRLAVPSSLLPATPSRNRWLIAASGVGIHLCIGSVYAYSVMTKPVAQLLHVSADQVKVSFSIAIFFLGLSAAFLGKFVERFGPRAAGRVSATCWGLGLVGAGLAVRFESIWMLYLSYGVLGGVGLGVGYITPVGTLVKWFPDKRGMATGLAIMGFGFAAMVAGPLMASLFNAGTPEAPVYTAASVSRTFFLCGAAYFVVMMLAAQSLVVPPAGYAPAGWDPSCAGSRVARKDLADLTAWEALGTRRFYLLWVMFGLNITCGITLISSASPMLQSMLRLTPLEAGAIVGFIGVFNGLGRIGWASASDYLGRPLTYAMFFAIQVVAFAVLPSITHAVLFQAVLFTIMTCYGGGFATCAAFLCDLFGTREVTRILGYTLTAWSVAGIVGPSVLIPLCRTATGETDYARLLYTMSALFGVALLAAGLLALDIRSKRRALAALAM